MKKTYAFVSLALVFVSLLTLTGCSTASASAATMESIAIVVGPHANSRELNLASQQVRDAVTRAVETEGFVSVICADGEPDIIAELSFKLDDRYRNADQTRLSQDAKNKVVGLLTELTEVKANSPEVDTLEAIRLAARTLGDAPAGSRKTLLVLDTGLSTIGLLSFGNNLLTADPEVIADMLDELEAIPELSGVRVIWQQLGDVAAPQEDLTPRQRNRLESVWRTVLERGGASFELSTAIPSNGKMDGLPEVSTLSLAKDAPIVFEPKAEALSFEEPIMLSENQVQFVGDSAEYLDRAQAEEVLSPVAAYMLAHEDFRLLLIGTTAGDGNSDYTLRLSADRANTVRNTLVSLGVPAERLATKGMGSSDPWHISGVGTDGPLASQNRKVVLIDADTDTANELLAQN